MLKLSELESWFDILHKIIFDLHISINNAKRLARKEGKYEYEDEALDYGFLRHHYYQLWFIMIIQLAKLFTNKDTQRRNFHKLCNCLENQKYGQDILEQFEKNKNAVFAEVFISKKEVLQAVAETRKDLIEKVVAIRDKVFAHVDPDAKEVIRDIKLDEIEILVKLSRDIFQRLRGQLFNIHMAFEIVSGWDVDSVIRDLSRNRKYVYEEHKRLIDERKKKK